MAHQRYSKWRQESWVFVPLHGPVFGSELSLREVVTVGKLLPLTMGNFFSLLCDILQPSVLADSVLVLWT